MGITNKRGQNTRRGSARIGGGIEEELNAIKPGLGTRLVSELNHHFSVVGKRIEAGAGHHGTVEIVAQKARDVNGITAPGIKLNSDRVSGVGDPIDNEDAINLRYFRRFQNCDWFTQMAEDCLEQAQAAIKSPTPIPTGEVHALFGYTYEIPNFTDTFTGDPGNLEANIGWYWEFIIPAATTLDRVSFNIPPGIRTPAARGVHGPIVFGLYSMDVAADSYTLAVRSESMESGGVGAGVFSINLEDRVTLEPGVYALAFIGPCFDMTCIRGNTVVFNLVNSLWPTLVRYGSFFTTGEMPDAIDLSNGFGYGLSSGSINVPLTYWDDSAEFG